MFFLVRFDLRGALLMGLIRRGDRGQHLGLVEADREERTRTGKNALDLSLPGSGSARRAGPRAPLRTSGFLSWYSC
jgi:hypothetical protein